MIRALGACCLVLLAGCASPVVTRIDAAPSAAVPPRASFSLAVPPGDAAGIHQQATDMIVAALVQRGWTRADTGDYLLSVTLSDRPATAQLQAGDDAGKPRTLIAPAVDRKTSRGCARRDHRLAIRLTRRETGEDVYSGSGAEYHCKAGLNDSLPYLVAAALDGLDGMPAPRLVERAGVR